MSFVYFLTNLEDFGRSVMSGRRGSTLDDGHAASAFQIHRENSYKKREVYEKLVASKKTPNAEAPSSIAAVVQSLDNPGPSSNLTASFSSRSSRQSAAKREINSTPAALLTLNGQSSVPPLFRSHVSDCKPHPVIFGENIFIECSLLKSNLLLLKEALLNSNLANIDLQTLTNDVRKAKEILVEQVSLPLNDIQRELQQQISQEQAAFHSTNPVPVYSLHEFRTSLPVTPTPSQPYPSHLYLYPVTEPLADRRLSLGISSDQSCIPYNAQPAH